MALLSRASIECANSPSRQANKLCVIEAVPKPPRFQHRCRFQLVLTRASVKKMQESCEVNDKSSMNMPDYSSNGFCISSGFGGDSKRMTHISNGFYITEGLDEFQLHGTRTLDPRGTVREENSTNGAPRKSQDDDCRPGTEDKDCSNGPPKKVSQDAIDEKERKRREKIGLANKGRTPWNKGKHHSAATIALMSARNKIVMQDPKIKEKLRQHSHPQSKETREKLSSIMKARMERERKQLTIVQEWKDIIAITTKEGSYGDDELQWDSYHILKEELRNEYLRNKKKEAKVRRSWTSEQRLRISQSIRAKWDDPEYRSKVIERIHETRHKGQRRTRSNSKLRDEEFDKILNTMTRSPTLSSVDVKFSEPKIGSYNDPLCNEKLEKIRRIRARKTGVSRVPAEREASNHSPIVGANAVQQAHREAAERARILLAEAERAAMVAAQALEAVEARDDSLSCSLLEARALLDEANRSMLNAREGLHR